MILPVEKSQVVKMKIPAEGIQEYRELVKRKHSLDITRAQAEEGLRDLLSLFEVIYRPMKTFDGEAPSRYNDSHEDE